MSSIPSKSSTAALTIGAIGVVYGDIGTSPLYALKETFHGGHVAVTPDNVYGILSLFIWTLTLVVSLKYVTLIMRADNHGEGGLMALLALATNSVSHSAATRRYLLMLGVFGVALFYGDGIITPAISVLSAVEGLTVVTPAAQGYVLPISLVILTVLFAVQKRGTALIGRFFGPITAVWFIALAALGLLHIVPNPHILSAINPWWAVKFAMENHTIAFVALGAVFLCVTGAEALYADMGHFGKRPIRIAWFSLVMPGLMLNYLGQGALILAQPETVKNPFYLMAPEWAVIPMIALATAATVIASQALISGAFSATKQTIQLGFLPRLAIRHTSARETGQIYIPMVNWLLYAGVVFAVVMFGSSSALASAYGISVSLVMAITTLLTFYVIRYSWKLPLWLCLLATGVFFVIDIAFLSSNLLKFADGGWFPALIAALLFTLMMTWKEGRRLVANKLKDESLELSVFLESVFLNPPARVSGTAVFLTPVPGITPNALLHNLKHNKVLHEHNLFVTVRQHEVPWIGLSNRVEIESLGHDCWQVVLNFGFKNDPDVPAALEQIKGRGCQMEQMETSYFLSRDVVVPTTGGGMAPWREKLFASMHHNAGTAAEFLNLPTNRVVELGSQVEI